MFSKLKKLLNSDEAKTITEKAKRLNKATQEKVDGMWSGIGKKAGEQLNRVTGDDSAADQVKEGLDQAGTVMKEGAKVVADSVDTAAEKTAAALNENAGTTVSKGAVKVAMGIGAAVVAGTADGLGDMAAGAEGLDGQGAAGASGGGTEIDMSQNGRVVTDGNTVHVTVDGMSVKG